MAERLWLTILITALALALYLLLQVWHKQRIGRITAVANTRPLLLYFRGASCAACPTQSRFVEQVAQQFSSRLQIKTVDAEQEPEVAAAYGIFSLPTTIVMDTSGAVKHINYGLTYPQKLAQQLEKLLS
jgi:thioredoxin-like negative regulator of GroEL